MSISREQEALIGRVFSSYLMEYHHDDILQLVTDPKDDTHHGVVVNAMTLFEANMEVGDYFNAYPGDVLPIFDKALRGAAEELSSKASSKGDAGPHIHKEPMRPTLHARITGLPVCPELTRVTIPRSRDVGHFLSVTGTVIRTSIAKVLEYERDYMCSKCRHVFTVQADFQQYYTFVPPTGCPNPEGCNSCKFSCLSGGCGPAACRDYQEIKIQEQVQRLSVGSIPRSLVVVLEDDLVDGCKSGDDVTVYGVMSLRWKPLSEAVCCEVELVLKANNVEVNSQHSSAALLLNDVQKEFEDYWTSYRHAPLAGRNRILLSLCPQVFGMYVIKLAVALVLAGGVQRTDSSGTKIRGECHMLLVGDPGTGKSQLLKYAAKILSRSVLTAGIGSTSAGLTVAAVKDGGNWHLEAGALVLADGGLCCIDEFNSIKEHDRISIHEAMEQQSISVAKAGMVCKLNTRTTILAATNPKGQYDSSQPLSVNVALASPLLSRFDLVLVLLDTRNAEWDRIISSYILEDGGPPACGGALWSLEKMKFYFSAIRTLQPQVSEEANCILARYYQLQRRSDGRNAARTTVRMLESLGRLAEAHARLMHRETVTIQDAVMAVSVMECSMQGGGLLGNVNALLTSFPAEPDRQYEGQCRLLLEGLRLPLLLQDEMERLARLKSSNVEASQRSPLGASDQHPFRGSDSKTPPHNPPSDRSGLHNNASSPPPDGSTASMQPNPQRTPSWRTKPPGGRTAASLHDFSVPLQSIRSEAEREHQNQEKRPQTQMEKLRSISQSHERLPEPVGGHALSEPDRLQGREQKKGEDAGKDPPGGLNAASEAHGSTVSSKEEILRGTATFCSLPGEKTAPGTETSSDLRSKLSVFKFKSKKMTHSAHNQGSKTTSATKRGINNQQQMSHSESDQQLPNTGTAEPNQIQTLENAHREGRDGAQSASACVPVQEVDGVATPSKTIGRERGSTNTKTPCRERTRVRVGANDGTVTPPLQASRRPAPLSSRRTETAVAKLSRFSFLSSTDLIVAPQPDVGSVVGGPRRAEGLPADTQDEQTRPPGRSPLRKRWRTTVQSNSPEAQQETQTSTPTSACRVKPSESRHASNASSESRHASNASSESRHAKNASSESRHAKNASSESLHANNASSESLHANNASSESLHANNASSESLHANNASSESLHAKNASSESLHAKNASSESLHANNASSESLHANNASSESLHANNASSESLHANNASSESLHAKNASSESRHAKNASSGPGVAAGDSDPDGGASTGRRRCFALGPSAANSAAPRPLFSGVSLFASPSLNDDVFDTDWDEEAH